MVNLLFKRTACVILFFFLWLIWVPNLNHASGSEDQLLIAEKFYKEMQYEEAIKILNGFIQSNKASPEKNTEVAKAYYLLARIYFDVDEEDPKIRENLLKVFEYKKDFYTEEINVQFKKRFEEIKSEKGIKTVKTTGKPEPTRTERETGIPSGKSIDWYIERGDSLFKAGKYKEAKKYFLKVLSIDKTDPIAKMRVEDCDLKISSISKEEIKFSNYLERAKNYVEKNKIEYALNYFLAAYRLLPDREELIAKELKIIAALDKKLWESFSQKNAKELGPFLEKFFTPGTPVYKSEPFKDIKISPLIKSKAKKIEKNAKGYWEVSIEENINMIFVPAGQFSMGSNGTETVKIKKRDGVIRTEDFPVDKDETPRHSVYIDGFFISKYEISAKQYVNFLNDISKPLNVQEGYAEYIVSLYNKKLVKVTFNRDSRVRYDKTAVVGEKFYVTDEDASHPASFITWNGAVEYCKWLSKKTGLQFRLPSEAEWEKAARGSEIRFYPWGNTGPDSAGTFYANYTQEDGTQDGFRETAPVNSFLIGASPYGILNMAGNVQEWVSDWYQRGYYKISPAKNPGGANVSTQQYGIVRGGGFRSGFIEIRTTKRTRKQRFKFDMTVGFRIAMDEK